MTESRDPALVPITLAYAAADILLDLPAPGVVVWVGALTLSWVIPWPVHWERRWRRRATARDASTGAGDG